jgi:hypothetical protein
MEWITNSKGMVGNSLLMIINKNSKDNNSDDGSSMGTPLDTDTSGDYKPPGGGEKGAKTTFMVRTTILGKYLVKNHTRELLAKMLFAQRIVMVLTVMTR